MGPPRTARLLPWLVVLGCQDYQLNPNDSAKYPYGFTETGVFGDVGLEDAPCFAAVTLPTTSAIDESCSAEAETGTLYATIEWSVNSFLEAPEYDQVLTVPVVGELDDDDGDGRITSDDVPDIVLVTDDQGQDGSNPHGVIRVLSGDSGTVWLTQAGVRFTEEDVEYQVYPYRYGNVALADVDADGVPEIVGIAEVIGSGGGGDGPPDTGDNGGGPQDTGVIIRPPPPPEAPTPAGVCAVVAWGVDGSLEWVNREETFGCAGHAPAVADLEGDGRPEVILGAMVLDGVTGALLWRGDSGEGRFWAYAEVGSQSFALDLDGDGIQEVLAGRTVYDAAGMERCSIDEALPDGFPAAADLDGDGFGEFVLVGDGLAHVHDTDCSLLASWELVGAGNGGPPTIADFDADGAPEIGIAEAETYSVYEPDGTVRWSNPTTDASSHTTGSSVFDFDGDGRAEVVYADEVALWIFDGVSGAVRLRDPTHTSRTLHEFPVTVDVDGDGMVEIVVPNGGGHHGVENTGVYVLGSADRTWMGDRKLWNQHAYSITNIADDLSVPAPARANWPEYNTFRSGDLSPTTGGLLADAIPYADTCDDPCEGDDIVLWIRVGNGGMGDMRSGVPVSIYTEDGGRVRHLGTAYTATMLASGDNSEAIEVRLDKDYVPEGVLIVVVDDDNGTGVVAECHEDNNRARLEGVFCPAE